MHLLLWLIITSGNSRLPYLFLMPFSENKMLLVTAELMQLQRLSYLKLYNVLQSYRAFALFMVMRMMRCHAILGFEVVRSPNLNFGQNGFSYPLHGNKA